MKYNELLVTEVLTIKMSRELKTRLRKLAKLEDRSVSKVARRALEKLTKGIK